MVEEYKTKNFRRLLTRALEPKEMNIIYDHYGLVSEEKSLDQIGKIYSLSRERIRQIEKRALIKILNSINNRELDMELINKINAYAVKSTPINQINDLSDIYINKGLIKLIIRLFPKLFSIYENEALNSNILILSDIESNITKIVNDLLTCLNQQTTFVDIVELAKYLKCDRKIILLLKDVEIQNNYIALKTNNNIFANSIAAKIERALEKAGRPLLTSEIAKETKLSSNQIRGALERVENAVNIGPSTYTLTKFGYIKGYIADVIEHFLNLAQEPLSIKQIVSLVKKQRTYKENSIIMALVNDKRFMRVEKGYYGLRNWNYEEVVYSRKRYTVDIQDALLQIIDIKPQQCSDIIKKLIKQFGDSTSHAYSTIYAVLEKLANKKIIQKISKGKSNYYYKN